MARRSTRPPSLASRNEPATGDGSLLRSPDIPHGTGVRLAESVPVSPRQNSIQHLRDLPPRYRHDRQLVCAIYIIFVLFVLIAYVLISCHLPHPHPNIGTLLLWENDVLAGVGGGDKKLSFAESWEQVRRWGMVRWGLWKGAVRRWALTADETIASILAKAERPCPLPHSRKVGSRQPGFKSWSCLGSQTPPPWLTSLFSSEKWQRRITIISSDAGST